MRGGRGEVQLFAHRCCCATDSTSSGCERSSDDRPVSS